MTWDTPRTWVANELMTAAKFNTVRDNLRFLFSRPVCRVYNDAAIPIANNVRTQLTFNNEIIDNASIHDTSSNASQLVAPRDGVYVVDAVVAWESGNNIRALRILKNGTVIITETRHPAISSTEITQSLLTQIFLLEGEYVVCEVGHNHGGDLDVNAFNHSPLFGMAFLSEGT